MASPSPVFSHFHALSETSASETHKARCKYCGFDVSIKGKSTSNLITHLKRKHPDVYQSLYSATPKSDSTQEISYFFEDTTVKKWRSTDRGKQEEITNAIVSFVADDLQALSVVESKAFRNVLQKAEPRYSMPSRKHLSTKLIPQRYQNIYADIVKLLSVSSQVCLTIDIWLNRQMRSYLGVTCHFIVDFKLQCTMLSCHRFRGSHTGERIIQLFEEIVTSFNISGKVDRVITDNASNMKKAFRLLEISCFEDDTAGEEDDHSNIDDLEIIETEGLLNQLEFHQIVPRHHACFDHTLQLVIKDALKNAGHIQRVLGKISKLISHVRHSSQACELFENDYKLQIANVTRWNSQLTMIKSLLDTSDENMKKLEYSGKLTVSETNTTKDLLEVLTPFQWATDLTQGGKKVTASVVLPIVRGLRTELAKLEKKFLSSFVATLKSSLDSRLSQYEEDLTFQLAAALDPRWKLAWCTPEESANLRKIIFRKVNEIAVDSTVCVITLPEQSPPPKRSALFNFIEVSPIYGTELGTNTIDKIEEYLNSPCLSEFTEPLIFWKNNQYKYEGLSKLACKYLQIPASSAPVERIFSIAGRIFVRTDVVYLTTYSKS